MNNLWIMVGVPGVGKSTWIKEHLNFFMGTTKVISRDEIRFSLLKDGEDYFAHENEVFKIFMSEINESLSYYEHTIVDATHLNTGSRNKLLRNIKNIGSINKINYICLIGTLDTCLSRNAKRTGRSKVPEKSLIEMYNHFKIPNINEENFDRMYIYDVDNTGSYKIIERSK